MKRKRTTRAEGNERHEDRSAVAADLHRNLVACMSGQLDAEEGAPRERDFWGKCVARASSFDHRQCPEPKHIYFIFQRKKKETKKKTRKKQKQRKQRNKREKTNRKTK